MSKDPGALDSPLRDALVVAALLVCTNGPVMYLAWHVLQGVPTWEDPAVRGIFTVTAAVSVLAVLLDSQRVSGRRLKVPSLVGGVSVGTFTAVIVASSFWSVDPSATRERSLSYVGLAALAWIIADLDFARFRRALAVTVALALAGSLVAVVLSTSIGRDLNGDWRGLFGDPNELGSLAALGLLVGVPALLATGGRDRVLPVSLGVMGLAALAGSGSLSAWLGLLGAVVCASLLWFASVGRLRFGSSAVHYASAVAALGAAATAVVAAAVWNSSTLALRRGLWEFGWEGIVERPIAGYGWFTVWDSIDLIGAGELWAIGSVHNSILGVWLGGGLLALIPFVAVGATALWGSGQALWRDPSADSWTFFALVVFLVAVNLTLSYVLLFSYNWVLLMGAALRPTGSTQRARPRHPAGGAHGEGAAQPLEP